MATYTLEQSGISRIQNNAVAGYLAYVGVDALPDLAGTPDAFSATLPISIPQALPGSGTDVINVVLRHRDSYGCVSQNQYPYTIVLNTVGTLMNDVLAPEDVAAFVLMGGYLRLRARYPRIFVDENPADKLKIWAGVTMPDPDIDTPVAIVDVTKELTVTEFGTFTPDTYIVLAGLFRTADSFLSEVVQLEVIIPDAPDEPIII